MYIVRERSNSRERTSSLSIDGHITRSRRTANRSRPPASDLPRRSTHCVAYVDEHPDSWLSCYYQCECNGGVHPLRYRISSVKSLPACRVLRGQAVFADRALCRSTDVYREVLTSGWSHSLSKAVPMPYKGLCALLILLETDRQTDKSRAYTSRWWRPISQYARTVTQLCFVSFV